MISFCLPCAGVLQVISRDPPGLPPSQMAPFILLKIMQQFKCIGLNSYALFILPALFMYRDDDFVDLLINSRPENESFQEHICSILKGGVLGRDDFVLGRDNPELGARIKIKRHSNQ